MVIWKRSFAKKMGQLTQGIKDIKGINTLFFILEYKVPFTTKNHIWKKYVRYKAR